MFTLSRTAHQGASKRLREVLLAVDSTQPKVFFQSLLDTNTKLLFIWKGPLTGHLLNVKTLKDYNLSNVSLRMLRSNRGTYGYEGTRLDYTRRGELIDKDLACELH